MPKGIVRYSKRLEYSYFKNIYIYINKGGRDTALEAEAQLYSDNITSK